MSRPDFDPVDRYIGANNLATYDFNFGITELTHLLVVVLNASDVEIHRLRGDDTTYIDTVSFDAVEGGGTVTLLANLPTGYTLLLLQANDEPVQEQEWRGKASFTLANFERAIDYITDVLARLSWFTGRTLRLNDAQQSVEDFDLQLPLDPEGNRVIMFSPDGLSIVEGPTPEELAAGVDAAADAAASASAAASSATDSQASAAAALASENNAETAEAAAAASAAAAAASAAAAAASAASFAGYTTAGPFVVTENTSADLTGLLFNHVAFTQIDFIARIIRGTAVFVRAEFSVFYRNGAWEMVDGGLRYVSTTSGVTFVVDATTAQISATVDNSGDGNATIDIKKLSWAA